ncbi:MAG: transcription elongation factor Spt5 [Candidatus Altiarchaeales archaeon IMC4]|nr:MAG: transcription elongation factor Spt5 [Candidatus Altiarchaeales archaeon IMC4]
MIYTVKVTSGQERFVAEMLYQNAMNQRAEMAKEGKEVYSILYTTGLKGYVLVEADSPGTVEDLARGVPKTRGLILKKKGDLSSAGTIAIAELEKTLVPTPTIQEVSKGDIIEIIAGPFKGEKARIANIDETKREITVELTEAAVPIPVVIRSDDVRVMKASDEERRV